MSLMSDGDQEDEVTVAPRSMGSNAASTQPPKKAVMGRPRNKAWLFFSEGQYIAKNKRCQVRLHSNVLLGPRQCKVIRLSHQAHCNFCGIQLDGRADYMLSHIIHKCLKAPQEVKQEMEAFSALKAVTAESAPAVNRKAAKRASLYNPSFGPKAFDPPPCCSLARQTASAPAL